MDFFVTSYRHVSIIGLMCLLFIFQHKAIANEETSQPTPENIHIERLTDAEVFASYNDELPAVLNYFTSVSEQQIIQFYKEHYGEVVKQEYNYERLTLTFKKNKHNIRVIISKQNNKHQVDILLIES